MPKKLPSITPISPAPLLLSSKVTSFVNHRNVTKTGSFHYLFNVTMRSAISNSSPISFSAALTYSINKAWSDATIHERRIPGSSVIANAGTIKSTLENELHYNSGIINSDFNRWHDSMIRNTMFGMTCGLWQKFINMTFKYLYCFKSVVLMTFPWEKCHCPLDSIITEKVYGLMRHYGITERAKSLVRSIANHGLGGVSWNNISINDYHDVQNAIEDICGRHSPTIGSKLFFDFLYW